MSTLADLLNAPSSYELDGETFHIRRDPDQLEQGEYERWLQQLALDNVLGLKYPTDEDRATAIQMHGQDCAAGVYEFGSPLAQRRLKTLKGFAKYLSVICRDQGLTEAKAERLFKQHAERLAAEWKARAEADPNFAQALATFLTEALGLSSDFFSSSSATTPTAPPATSTASSAAPTPN